MFSGRIPGAGVFLTAWRRSLEVGKQVRFFCGAFRARQQVDNPLRDDARLTAARPGDNQHRAFTMLDGLRLFGVQLER